MSATSCAWLTQSSCAAIAGSTARRPCAAKGAGLGSGSSGEYHAVQRVLARTGRDAGRGEGFVRGRVQINQTDVGAMVGFVITVAYRQAAGEHRIAAWRQALGQDRVGHRLADLRAQEFGERVIGLDAAKPIAMDVEETQSAIGPAGLVGGVARWCAGAVARPRSHPGTTRCRVSDVRSCSRSLA